MGRLTRGVQQSSPLSAATSRTIHATAAIVQMGNTAAQSLPAATATSASHYALTRALRVMSACSSTTTKPSAGNARSTPTAIRSVRHTAVAKGDEKMLTGLMKSADLVTDMAPKVAPMLSSNILSSGKCHCY